MTTNFFQTIDGLNIMGDWKITVSKTENDKWAVSILLVNEKLEDDAKKIIPPMILKGTAKELDEGFFKAIEIPVKKTADLFANMENYLASLEEAEKNSKMEKEKEDKEKKGIEERKKKYEAKMKNVAGLEEKEKWGEAIGQMPSAEKFPEQAEEIKKKLDELKSKHGQLALL